MPESGNRLVVSVITDKEDVSSSSAPNTKARREKAPAVAIKTPELESPPVELPQAPETQESVSSTEVHIEEIVKQVNECRIKNAHKLGIPTESVKTEQIPSNSGAWMVRFINETGSVPTLEDDLEKLRELVDWVWSPKNGYRAEIVLLRHHKRDNFIAIVRDDRDNSNLLRVERSYRETPEKALARLPSEIGSKYPGTDECLKWKRRHYDISIEPDRESLRPYRGRVRQLNTDTHFVKGSWWEFKEEAYEDLLKKVQAFVKKQLDDQRSRPS